MWIDNPLTYIAGPELVVVADGSGHWSADFSGVFDIGYNTKGQVKAECLGIYGGDACGGNTIIEWP